MSIITPLTTPARLTTSAASKLPRAVLWVVGLIYIFAGLFLRDPWKTDDVIGLAAMLSAVQYESWLAFITPRIGDLAFAEIGPLHIWIGALSITLFGPVFEFFTSPLDASILASRLPNLLYFLILISTLWQGVFRLASRRAAQPLPLPFGGEPSTVDYGRMLADAALLLCVATIGIIWRLHETSSVPLSLALYSTAFYALSLTYTKPVRAGLLLGAAIGLSFLNQGLWVALSLSFSAIMAYVLCFSLRQHLPALALTLFTALVIATPWTLAAKDYPYWWQQWQLWHLQQIHWPNTETLLKSGRDVLWFLWPTWPLVIVALWQWRSWLRFAHIAIPFSLLLGPLVLLLLSPQAFEPEYALLVVPCAALAAFALPTLRRSTINSFDWFAVMCFSLFAATVWLGWIAQQTGWPTKIAHSIHRQTQGFDTDISWLMLIAALLGTAAWVALVSWRLRTHPPALWRGTVLSAGGLITTWLLLVTLWLPALDYARSYRQVSQELAQQLALLPESACVRARGLGLGQRASFYAFNQINLSFETRCNYILQQTSPKLSPTEQNRFLGPVEELWQGRRGGDRNEMFRLLKSTP